MKAPATELPEDLAPALLLAAEAALAGPSSGPEAVDASCALQRALGRPVAGAVLFGSRARGEATVTSDFDAVVFADGDERGGLRGTSAGVELDIEVVPAGVVACEVPADWIHLGGGVALIDPIGAVGEFLRRVRDLYALGPAPMKLDDVTRQRVWAKRMCSRIARHIDTDPTLAAYQSAWLLTTLLDLYFQFRKLWTRSAKESLRYWSREDPGQREAWDAYAVARTPKEQLAALERIVALTLAVAVT